MVSFSSEVFFFLLWSNTCAWFSWPIRGEAGLSEDMHGCALWSFPTNMLVITSTKVMLQHTHPCSSCDQTAGNITTFGESKARCRRRSMFKRLKVMALDCT